jgi:hypothetical protein
MERDDRNYYKYNLVKTINNQINDVVGTNVDAMLAEIIGTSRENPDYVDDDQIYSIEEIGHRYSATTA